MTGTLPATIVPARLCLVTYKFGGNGPWNYMYERPPAGVKLVHLLAAYIEEKDGNHYVACDWMTLEDGTVQPIHTKQFGTSSVDVRFL